MQGVSIATVRRFQPQPTWFARGPGGIHGVAHETRVLIWSQVLATMAADEGLTVDPDVLGWASAVHDTQRHSDDRDLDHGLRAAAWIEQRRELIPVPVPLARVAYLCRWHVPPDHAAPEMTDELRVFKDADALDRWRIYDLDPALLRTTSAHRLLTASRKLWSLTDAVTAGTQGFQQVIRAAVGLGILQDE